MLVNFGGNLLHLYNLKLTSRCGIDQFWVTIYKSSNQIGKELLRSKAVTVMQMSRCKYKSDSSSMVYMTIELIDGLVFEAGHKTNAIHSGEKQRWVDLSRSADFI